MAKRPTLQLTELDLRHPGVTPGLAASYCEAASVCLSKHHQSPHAVQIDHNNDRATIPLEWDRPTQRIENGWANVTDAIEAGACACVLAAVERMRHLVAIRRAETGTGADYYLAPAEAPVDDLESHYRLEVSGSDAASEPSLRIRLRQKLEQAANGRSNLPAIAGVVGFKELLILLEDLEAS